MNGLRLASFALLMLWSLHFATPLLAGAATKSSDEDEFQSLKSEMQRELSSFQEETDTEIRQFRDERDRAFAEFLQEQWSVFAELSALIADPEPKPKVIPKASTTPRDLAVPPQGKKVVVRPTPTPTPTPITAPTAAPVPAAPIIAPVPIKPVKSTPPTLPASGSMAKFDFFGIPLAIPYDPALQSSVDLPITNRAISHVWASYGSADFPPLLNRLDEIHQQLRLNDWAYYLLLRDLAGAVQNTPNDAELFTWFLLIKSGYLCKVGFNGNEIFLLAPALPMVYEVPYFNLNGSRYFNLSYLRKPKSPGQIMTYGENYPGADKQLALQMTTPPLLGRERFTRQLKFRYAGRDYALNINGGRQNVLFLENYPQTDFPIFFAAKVNHDTESALVEALKPVVSGKTEAEAVNLLLRFVQTAFEYKTDEDQFGKEKYLFVEETLFFPYSDCEDRSILFSFLVRKLTGLEVVGLHFPGHIATAVHFSTDVVGDKIQIEGKPFLVCDPTYINANIGMTMPQFANVKPEIIHIGL